MDCMVTQGKNVSSSILAWYIWYSGILAPTWNLLYLPRIVYRIVINNCVSSHLIDSFRLHCLPIYFHESRGLYFPFNYSLIVLRKYSLMHGVFDAGVILECVGCFNLFGFFVCFCDLLPFFAMQSRCH